MIVMKRYFLRRGMSTRDIAGIRSALNDEREKCLKHISLLQNKTEFMEKKLRDSGVQSKDYEAATSAIREQVDQITENQLERINEQLAELADEEQKLREDRESLASFSTRGLRAYFSVR
jgi:chromosome segregation ATPase